MVLTFNPLTESHFPLLLKWLETPHVKQWWDSDINWTLEKIQGKFNSYIKGYKVEEDRLKPIKAYIIKKDKEPIGYFQTYNAYDFQRSKPLQGLPDKLAAFDIFIGEETVLKHGLASQALLIFFEKYLNSFYTHIFADPDCENSAAIKTYEKVGFKSILKQPDTNEIWMLKEASAKRK